jgi:hypothetical protein
MNESLMQAIRAAAAAVIDMPWEVHFPMEPAATETEMADTENTH